MKRLSIPNVNFTLFQKVCETDKLQSTYCGRRVTPVDTTGAGDTFNASFVYGMSQGLGVREAGEYASAAAARSILYMGPRSGAVGVEQVEQFISTYKGKFKEEA